MRPIEQVSADLVDFIATLSPSEAVAVIGFISERATSAPAGGFGHNEVDVAVMQLLFTAVEGAAQRIATSVPPDSGPVPQVAQLIQNCLTAVLS